MRLDTRRRPCLNYRSTDRSGCIVNFYWTKPRPHCMRMLQPQQPCTDLIFNSRVGFFCETVEPYHSLDPCDRLRQRCKHRIEKCDGLTSTLNLMSVQVFRLTYNRKSERLVISINSRSLVSVQIMRDSYGWKAKFPAHCPQSSLPSPLVNRSHCSKCRN